GTSATRRCPSLRIWARSACPYRTACVRHWQCYGTSTARGRDTDVHRARRDRGGLASHRGRGGRPDRAPRLARRTGIGGGIMVTDRLIAVARTLYGEARGTGLMDRLGVLAVIRERVLRPGWWGRDWQSVVQARGQFTCWSQHDEAHRRNFEAMMQAEARDPATWRSLLLLADYAQHMTDRDISAMFEAD